MDRRKHENIDVIARAIILDETGEKMLFCAPKNKSYYYLPGGHIEFSETARKALKRELSEETGIKTDETHFTFIGSDENIFLQSGEKQHEVNFYFKVDSVFPAHDSLSKEGHIIFSWIPVSDLSRFPVLPETIKGKCEGFLKGDVKWSNL